MNRIACLLILASASLAAADDERHTDRGYVATSYSLLFTAMDAATSILAAEGGVRVPNTPLVVRGFAGFGGGADGGEDTRTRAYELRAGVEADSCTPSRAACVFGGVDVGHRFATTTTLDDEMTSDTSGQVLVYRLGADAGGDFVRVRLELERSNDAGGLQLALMHRFE